MDSTNAFTTSSSEVPSGTSTFIVPCVVYSTFTLTSLPLSLGVVPLKKASIMVCSISFTSSVLKLSVTGLLISILATNPVMDGAAVGILEVGAITGDFVGNGTTRAISSLSIFNPKSSSMNLLSTSSKITLLSDPSILTSISILISSFTVISSILISKSNSSSRFSNSSLIAPVISSLFVSIND